MTGNGTTIVNEGLTGLPFVIVLAVFFALAAVAARRFYTRNHLSVMIPSGGAFLALYVLWIFWPVLVVAIVLLGLGLANKVFPKAKHVTTSATRAGVAAARTAPPARRVVVEEETPAAE